MNDASGLFSMDVHRLFRTFIPGLISIFTFLPFYYVVKGGTNFVYLQHSGTVLSLLILAYIIGTLLEFISQAAIHRLSQCIAYCTIRYFRYELLYREIKELGRISRKNLTTRQKIQHAMLIDYYLHEEKNKHHRDRIVFAYSRVGSIFASIVGIFLAVSFGIIWIWKAKCLNAVPWLIVIMWASILIVLYFFYIIHRNNLIAYERAFIKINKDDLKKLIQYKKIDKTVSQGKS